MLTTSASAAARDSLTLMTGVSLVLGALAVAGVWRLRSKSAGTTLRAAWYWACGATCVASLAALGSGHSDETLPRYVAGILLLAPTLAVLGAKRPQHVAWQWVVVAFLALLALPAASTWMFRPGGNLRVDAAWQWLLVAAVVVGCVNYLPTARAPAALAAAAAQVCWLGDQFPEWLRVGIPAREQVGLAFIAVAAWLASIGARRAMLPPLDRAWLDFRDAFGAAWSLRVAEQFNATAARSNWPVRLHWSRFTNNAAGATPAPLPPEAQQCLENLLRRFVSRAWIETRTK